MRENLAAAKICANQCKSVQQSINQVLIYRFSGPEAFPKRLHALKIIRKNKKLNK